MAPIISVVGTEPPNTPKHPLQCAQFGMPRQRRGPMPMSKYKGILLAVTTAGMSQSELAASLHVS